MLTDHAVLSENNLHHSNNSNNATTSDDTLKRAAQAFLTCIPPCRPIDIVTKCILRDELASPSIDYLAVAQVSPTPSVSVDTIDVNELIVLLNGVTVPDLPNLDVHDKTSLSARIASKLKGNNNGHATSISGIGNAMMTKMTTGRSHMHNSGAMSSAMCSDEESVKSVQSAAGHLPGLTRQPVVQIPAKKQQHKASRLRVDRQSIGGGNGLIGTAIDGLLNQQDLSTEQVMALKEAVDSGSMLQHTQPAFTLISLWSELFVDRPDNVELVLAFCLTALSIFLETKTSAILPFDVNEYLFKVIPIMSQMTCPFELKHCLVSLSCIFASKVVDDSVLSAYFMNCVDMIRKPEKARKPLLPQTRNMLFVNFATQSDLMKERSLVDLMESLSTSSSTESVKLAVDLVNECMASVGGKDKLLLLNHMCKLLSDYVWHRIIDPKCVGERREFIYGVVSEFAASMMHANCYPSFIICQTVVPLCIKSLGKESTIDSTIKCRLIEIVGKVVSSLNSPPIDYVSSAKPPTWIELYESWSDGKSSYSLVIQESILYRNKDKMLAFLTSLCSAEAVTVRLKAMRAVVAAGKSCQDVVLECLETKLSDPSPAARDCILDALLKDFCGVSLSDSIVKQVCSRLSVQLCVQDSSNTVQKKAVKLLSTQISLNHGLLPLIISSLLSRTLTTDAFTESCYLVLRDEWFTRSLEKPDVLITTIMKVGELLTNQQSSLKWFVDRLLSDSSISHIHDQIVNFFNGSVDKLIDKLLDLHGATEKSQSTSATLAAIAVFSQSTPRLLEPHLDILKHFATSSDHHTVEAALALFAQCSGHVSVSLLKGLKGFTELLTKAILTGTEGAVRFAIDCLYIYCSRVEGNFELILKLWSKFSKYLRSQLDEPSGSTASYSRALFSLGCLCRHSGRAESDSANIPGHLRSAVQIFLRWFKNDDCERSVHNYALQSIVKSIESFPSLLVDPMIFDLVHGGLKQSDHLATMLNCITDCLVVTNQRVNTDISFDPSAANRQSVNPLTASIIQKYLSFIFDSIINEDQKCQMAAIKLLFRLLLFGNTNPFTLVPFIVAFTASPSEAVRGEAEQALTYLVDKHPSFITSQLGRTVKICYQICDGHVWTTNLESDTDEATSVIGPLTSFYEKCAELKRKGADIISRLSRLICEAKDLHFSSWLVQSVSLVRLRHASEVAIILKHISQESALIAESIMEEGAVDAVDVQQLIKFIILSTFHGHLKRVYSGVKEAHAGNNTKQVLKQKPKLFHIPSDWLNASQEQAYEECMRIIQEDTIRVTLEDLEDSDELSMKSPPTTTVQSTAKSGKTLRRPKTFKVSKSKANPVKKRTIVIPVADSPGSQRKSSRASQSRVNYFESSDEDVNGKNISDDDD